MQYHHRLTLPVTLTLNLSLPLSLSLTLTLTPSPTQVLRTMQYHHRIDPEEQDKVMAEARRLAAGAYQPDSLLPGMAGVDMGDMLGALDAVQDNQPITVEAKAQDPMAPTLTPTPTPTPTPTLILTPT